MVDEYVLSTYQHYSWGEGGRAAGNRQLSTVTIKAMKVVSRMKYLLSFQLILTMIVVHFAVLIFRQFIHDLCFLSCATTAMELGTTDASIVMEWGG